MIDKSTKDIRASAQALYKTKKGMQQNINTYYNIVAHKIMGDTFLKHCEHYIEMHGTQNVLNIIDAVKEAGQCLFLSYVQNNEHEIYECLNTIEKNTKIVADYLSNKAQNYTKTKDVYLQNKKQDAALATIELLDFLTAQHKNIKHKIKHYEDSTNMIENHIFLMQKQTVILLQQCYKYVYALLKKQQLSDKYYLVLFDLHKGFLPLEQRTISLPNPDNILIS